MKARRQKSKPSGARVLLHGQRLGETPLDVEQTESESQHYDLQRNGYKHIRVELPGVAGDDGVAEVMLEPRVRPEPSRRERTRKTRKLGEGDTLDWY